MGIWLSLMMYTVVFCIAMMIVDLFMMLRYKVYMCVLAVLLLVTAQAITQQVHLYVP